MFPGCRAASTTEVSQVIDSIHDHITTVLYHLSLLKNNCNKILDGLKV